MIPVIIPSEPYYASRYAAKAIASTTRDERADGEVDAAEHEPRCALAPPSLRLGDEVLGLLDRIGHVERHTRQR